MPSIDQLIAGINKKKLNGNSGLIHNLSCSCRNKPCCLSGKCNVKDVVYEATLQEPNTSNIDFSRIVYLI